MKSLRHFLVALFFAVGMVSCNNAADEPDTIEIEEDHDADHNHEVEEVEEEDKEGVGIDIQADDEGNVDGKVEGDIRFGDKDDK